ncbi:DDE-type integrase/transposase/recombinase [Desulfotomaculum sp. 1211_IL3151]|uniref:DDE-type integrase/transposase/recombinase n=1 Tax=Desulfotomaculum sp. 1211_IL3151 TaxID=3084055 RepID=UPI002FDB6F93
MFRVQVEVGIRFKLNEKIYRILKVYENRDVQVRDEKYQDVIIFTEIELRQQLDSGSLVFESKGKNYSPDLETGIKFNSDFGDLSSSVNPKYIKAAKFRLKVIEPLLNIENRTKSTVSNRVMEVNSLLSDQYSDFHNMYSSVCNSISCSSVYQWIKDYTNSGRDFTSLIPSYHRSGGKNKSRMNQKVLLFIDEIINKYYKDQLRLTKDDIYYEVIHRIEEHFLVTGKKIHHPSYPTIARIINTIPEAELVLKRHGKKQAKETFDKVGAGVQVERILERVEIDHSPIDLLVPDENNKLRRPYITAAIDKFSRMILGFCISFEPPSYSTVMQCLRHVLMDKSYIKEKYPSIENEWHAYGVPKVIIVDNGAEFHGNALKDACEQLDILIYYAPRRTPEWKASIERYFRSFQSGLIHKMPGTTRSNVQDLGEIDPSKHACIDMSLLLELIHKWIVDVYSRRVNRGAKGVPSLVWDHNVKIYPPAWLNSTHDIPILLGYVTERVIRDKGVELDCLYYNSTELNKLLCSFTRQNNGYNQGFKIKWDPLDISHIYLYDHIISKRWLKIPAVDQDYSKGLTSWEHKLARKISREMFCKVDEISLARAKHYILQKGRDPIDKSYDASCNISQAKKQGSKEILNNTINTTSANESYPESPVIMIKESDTHISSSISNIGFSPDLRLLEESKINNVIEISSSVKEKTKCSKKSSSTKKEHKTPQLRSSRKWNDSDNMVIDNDDFDVTYDF